MRIWVDADGCPGAVKNVLFRAAERVQVELTLVANKLLHVPRSRFIHALRVPHGFDVADGRIVELMQAGDLVITADIPLASEVVARDGYALSPRGELYTEENIGDRLALRNLMDELRSTGMNTGGPPSFNESDRRAFANQLDRLLTRIR